ncbi:MAG: TauD/TfdA family dioxygenase [Rhodospirillaceae bacterium]|nr:TauD/TfdA family dioxygenase [Rhodospirillaceae bacterium]
MTSTDRPPGRAWPPTPDFDVWPVEHLPAAAETDGRIVTVTWDDGRVSRYHAIWLRDNAADPATHSPATREQVGHPWDLPEDLAVTSASLAGDGSIEVAFAPEGRTLAYHPGWLRALDYSNGRHDDLGDIAPTYWDCRRLAAPPTFDGPACLERDGALLEALEALMEYGIVRLRGVPADETAVQRVAERIGTIRNSNFGFLFDVKTAPADSRKAADSNAYFAGALAPHTDLATREYEPGLQLLHCLKNTTRGGRAVYVDGFAVADRIRQTDADLWRAVTQIEWTFTNRSPVTDYRWRAPLVVLDGNGDPREIRATTFLRGPLNVDYDDVEAAYAGLRAFQTLAASERFAMTFDYAPGDLIAFDNRRVLHGRTAFDEAAGERALKGCYMEREEVLSRIRVLRRARRANRAA